MSFDSFSIEKDSGSAHVVKANGKPVHLTWISKGPMYYRYDEFVNAVKEAFPDVPEDKLLVQPMHNWVVVNYFPE